LAHEEISEAFSEIQRKSSIEEVKTRVNERSRDGTQAQLHDTF
jgi:hypothetical protein